ncbi:hypothetical protein ACFL3D_01565 [Candidatus Omnitrophota bacterium]
MKFIKLNTKRLISLTFVLLFFCSSVCAVEQSCIAVSNSTNFITSSMLNEKEVHAWSECANEFTFTSPLNSEQQRELLPILSSIAAVWNSHKKGTRVSLRRISEALTMQEEAGGCSLKLIKLQGVKAVFFSESEKYVIKFNFEQDNASIKETAFFSLGYNLYPENRFIGYHKEAPIKIFENFAYEKPWITLFDFLHTPGLKQNKLRQIIYSLGVSYAELHKKIPDFSSIPFQMDHKLQLAVEQITGVIRESDEYVYLPQDIEGRCYKFTHCRYAC